MKHLLYASLLTCSIATSSVAQQWHLVTPVKNNAKLGDIKMTDPVTGYMIDEVQGSILSTTDGGAHWERKANNLTGTALPRALWMWDNNRGIISANSGRLYHTADGFNVITPTNIVLTNKIGRAHV